jgi:hypothetical protein
LIVEWLTQYCNLNRGSGRIVYINEAHRSYWFHPHWQSTRKWPAIPDTIGLTLRFAYFFSIASTTMGWDLLKLVQHSSWVLLEGLRAGDCPWCLVPMKWSEHIGFFGLQNDHNQPVVMKGSSFEVQKGPHKKKSCSVKAGQLRSIYILRRSSYGVTLSAFLVDDSCPIPKPYTTTYVAFGSAWLPWTGQAS